MLNKLPETGEDKIEEVSDILEYIAKEYRWEKDDGDERLMVWIDFRYLKTLTELFSQDTIDECPDDFECILRHDCVVFPHFEYVLPHLDIDEEDIERIFPR